jgi:hypothetical protein
MEVLAVVDGYEDHGAGLVHVAFGFARCAACC